MKTPFAYAGFAALYISGIVSGAMNIVPILGPHDDILMPMAMLSLFVLSVAVMGFLFVSEPLLLCFENKTKEAVSFFLCTVGFFACFAALFAVAAIGMSFL